MQMAQVKVNTTTLGQSIVALSALPVNGSTVRAARKYGYQSASLLTCLLAMSKSMEGSYVRENPTPEVLLGLAVTFSAKKKFPAIGASKPAAAVNAVRLNFARSVTFRGCTILANDSGNTKLAGCRKRSSI